MPEHALPRPYEPDAREQQSTPYPRSSAVAAQAQGLFLAALRRPRDGKHLQDVHIRESVPTIETLDTLSTPLSTQREQAQILSTGAARWSLLDSTIVPNGYRFSRLRIFSLRIRLILWIL